MFSTYEFNVGDKVKSIDGFIGYVVHIEGLIYVGDKMIDADKVKLYSKYDLEKYDTSD